MSALLKPAAAASVRPFGEGGAVPAAVVAAPAPDPRELELEALRETVAQLSRELRDSGVEKQRAVAAAHAEGRAEGLAESVDREEDRLAAVRDGVESAAEAFRARLALLDGLAAALARAALDKLFEGREHWADATEAMLARQMAVLRRSSVVAVRLSRHDFADAEAMRAMAESLGAADMRFEIDPGLRAGACRIECRLGEIDLDTRAQWATLAGLLDHMAGGA